MGGRERQWEPPRAGALVGGRWVAVAMALVVGLVVGLGSAGCAPSGAAQAILTGSASIAGSTALQPLVTEAAKRFQMGRPGVRITVSGGGSLHGIQAVTSHQVAVGDSDVYADPGAYPDPTLTDHLVAVIPFTLIVNRDVTGVTSLTRDQIIGIYSTGAYTNWRQLGGPDLPIAAVVRPATSGTRLTFRTYVMGGRDETGIFLKTDSSQTVLTTVAQTPGAIGYVGLSVLDKSVTAVGIAGVEATPASIEAGRYPFWGYEHMYTLGDGSPLVSAFLDYMLTPEIQMVAQEMGYIPIAQMRLAGAGPGGGAAPPLAQAPHVAAIVQRESRQRDARRESRTTAWAEEGAHA